VVDVGVQVIVRVFFLVEVGGIVLVIRAATIVVGVRVDDCSCGEVEGSLVSEETAELTVPGVHPNRIPKHNAVAARIKIFPIKPLSFPS
jgi:hypothetical protein